MLKLGLYVHDVSPWKIITSIYVGITIAIYISLLPEVEESLSASGNQYLIDHHAQNLDVESNSLNAVTTNQCFQQQSGCCYYVTLRREFQSASQPWPRSR
ncbi:hypothetical protein VNO78_07997 [Psophocarpus tetragonolobus]|uniref:Uncharacterized protein n=1 Tax=Psophocarpus tetragonolobus TaxID=3891 RepID=A0AAN9XSK1_PSOTE